MEIDQKNRIIIQRLFWNSESNELINPAFIEEWLSEFNQLDNYLKVFNSGDVMLQAIMSYKNVFENINEFFKRNEECFVALNNYPGKKDENSLLKWICTYSKIMDDLTFEIIYLLEDYKVNEDLKCITFIQTIGERINQVVEDNKYLDFGQFIPLSTEKYVTELESLRYTLNFCNLIWDLYYKKLEQYQTLTQEELDQLPEEDPEKINQGNLQFQLMKRGINF